MKCEMCHIGEAETAVHIESDGAPEELYVCRSCAARAASLEQAGAGDVPSGEGSSEPREMIDQSAAAIMGLLFNTAFEVAGHDLGLPREPVCPACGIKRREYRTQSRLGCPECYTAFAKELEATIADLHQATRHTGSLPSEESVEMTLKLVEQELAEALKAHDRDEAARLRARIKILQMEDILQKSKARYKAMEQAEARAREVAREQARIKTKAREVAREQARIKTKAKAKAGDGEGKADA